ncbi:hypothetical protein VP01_32g35 [Puccinia sorghi]|uniref:Homeobox domain-containing protein n=1 Tax=Puccinia sorghi TaxID=27349 RepID=A0A0L6UXM5_9BASI|nr:hypothetical protein VP01_32g35 [Puccinia sorghi]
MAPWWISTSASAIKLRRLTENLLPASFLDSFFNGIQPGDIPPLHFPEVRDVLPELLQLGLDVNRANLLDKEFTSTVEQIDEYLLKSYQGHAPKFRSVKGLQTSRSAFIEALQSQSLAVRSLAIQRSRKTILSHVQSLRRTELAQLTPQPSTPSTSGTCNSSGKPRGRAQKFTKIQTAALNALLAHENQYSSQDKDLIAHELNLTREQVNRWFCNARARKKPYSCPSRRPNSAALKSLSDNSPRNSTPSTQSEQNHTQASPRSSSSEDSDMIITTSSSSSSGDDPMDAYFDFPAYTQAKPSPPWQSNSLPQIPQTGCPHSFNFDTLNDSCASSPSDPAIDPRLWSTQPTFNSSKDMALCEQLCRPYSLLYEESGPVVRGSL